MNEKQPTLIVQTLPRFVSALIIFVCKAAGATYLLLNKRITLLVIYSPGKDGSDLQ